MAEGKKIAQIIRVINICVGIFLGFIGVWKIVTLSFITSIGSKFFCIFMPLFMILFGIMIIIAEVKKDFGSEYFKFIQTFLGKGVFYLFLSSLSVYQIEDETSDLIGYIYGLILLVFGVMYVIFHFCKCSGTLGEVREGYDFCSIINFLGAIFFLILAALVGSGHKYQEWDIHDDSKSKTALFISAGIHFGLFILCLIWKFLKEKQIAREESRLGQKGFQKYYDEDISNSSPHIQGGQINNDDLLNRNESNQSNLQGLGDGIIN